MQKTKYYYSTQFSVDVLSEARQAFLGLAPDAASVTPQTLSVKTGTHTWNLDSVDEFLVEARDGQTYRYDHIFDGCRLLVEVQRLQESYVHVAFPERASIEAVFNVFEKHLDSSKVITSREPIKVFIGHGRDPQWRDLKDHLHDQHGLEVVAYEIGPRAGSSVKDVLESMLTDSSFALLVLTGEDEQTDGSIHARQNVVHELGLFQGRLGFTRAVALLESGVVEFSNILGVNQIRFSPGAIRETFGDVVATIQREFGEQA